MKDQFGVKGAISDIQLKYTKTGEFRQFAYIGYLNENDATDAINTFNKTFIQTQKIIVEQCAALGEHIRPWSKHTVISKVEQKSPEKIEKLQKINKKALIEDIIGEHKDDPKFKEFMQAHDSKRNLWGNDADELTTTKEGENEEISVPKELVKDDSDASDEKEEKKEEKLANKTISDLDYMNQLKQNSSLSKTEKKPVLPKEDFFSIKITNVPYNCKRSKIVKFFKPLKPDSVRFPPKQHGFCWVGFKSKTDFNKAMLKDKSFIDGKQVFLNKSESKLSDNIQKSEKRNSKWVKQEESLAGGEEICDSGKIFFRNLAYTTTEEQLEELFQKYGPVAEVFLPVDSVTRQIKGFGTVAFVMPEHAVQAFNELDGSVFQGRLLHLMPAKVKDTEEDDAKFAAELEGMNFKEKKEALLKKSAQKNHNWNTLFLGSDAVANVLAQRFETTKETVSPGYYFKGELFYEYLSFFSYSTVPMEDRLLLFAWL